MRRPKVPDESQVLGLDRAELNALLAAAESHSTRGHALVALLAFNGLRISEVLGADAGDFGHQRGVGDADREYRAVQHNA